MRFISCLLFAILLSGFSFASTYDPVKEFKPSQFRTAMQKLEDCARLNPNQDVVILKFTYDQLDGTNSPEKFLKEYLFDRYLDQFSSYRYTHLAFNLAFFKQVSLNNVGISMLDSQKDLIRKSANEFQNLWDQKHYLLLYEGILGLKESIYTFIMIVDTEDHLVEMIAVQN